MLLLNFSPDVFIQFNNDITWDLDFCKRIKGKVNRDNFDKEETGNRKRA